MGETHTKTLQQLGLLPGRGQDDLAITGLSLDSRDVKEGHLFAALPGSRVHGATFVQYALRMGARVILTDAAGAEIAAPALSERPALVLEVADPRQTLAYAAALWFGAQPETMVAVTGTNGKTSVASFCRQIWEEMGESAINLGTTGVEGAISAPLQHTTPEPLTLHRLLARAAGEGVRYAAMEASSHGLEQRRLDGVRLRAAAFSNFTQDHLDYHESFDAYFRAKAGLFDRVLPVDGCAVINIDDPRGPEMAAIAGERAQSVIAVGRDPGADLRLLGQRYDATGQDVLLSWKGRNHQLRLDLIGGFQGENVLLAAGLVIGCGGEAEAVFRVLPRLRGVRGRMQLAARRSNGAAVFVDYSHTPAAVETALKALRPHVMGRLGIVVGAGGDRDPGKRVHMGRAAAENADWVVVTDDNPRTEDPAMIRAAVMEGAPEASEVGDRAEAILRAVDALGAGDVLLIAGKGHESGQIVGEDVLPFDDCEQASVAVAALEGGL